MRTLYPANLPPPGSRESTESFGFWFWLLFWGTMASIFVTWGLLGSKPESFFAFFLGAPFTLIFLMRVVPYGYLVPRLWSSVVAKFYLSESTATVSHFLRAGEEFQFTYRQSFKRRTRVRRLCIALVSREYEAYEVEGADETIKMERWDDKAIEEFNQPGWQAQPGENLQQTVTFRFADPPILLNKSESYLIKVYIYLNWLVTLQRVYRLYMSPS